LKFVFVQTGVRKLSNPYQSPAPNQPQPPNVQPRGPYKPCPNCQQYGADKVGWTLWGGVLGPKLLSHVKCQSCKTTFNGKTGASNTTAIIIYLVVTLVIGTAIGLGVGIMFAAT